MPVIGPSMIDGWAGGHGPGESPAELGDFGVGAVGAEVGQRVPHPVAVRVWIGQGEQPVRRNRAGADVARTLVTGFAGTRRPPINDAAITNAKPSTNRASMIRPPSSARLRLEVSPPAAMSCNLYPGPITTRAST